MKRPWLDHSWLLRYRFLDIAICLSACTYLSLKLLFMDPKFQFLECISQNLGVHRSHPQKAHPSLEWRVLSRLWSRSDTPCTSFVYHHQYHHFIYVYHHFCMYTGISHGRNLGKFGGPQLSYQTSQENSTPPLSTLQYYARNNWKHSAVSVGHTPRGTFYAFWLESIGKF